MSQCTMAFVHHRNDTICNNFWPSPQWHSVEWPLSIKAMAKCTFKLAITAMTHRNDTVYNNYWPSPQWHSTQWPMQLDSIYNKWLYGHHFNGTTHNDHWLSSQWHGVQWPLAITTMTQCTVHCIVHHCKDSVNDHWPSLQWYSVQWLLAITTMAQCTMTNGYPRNFTMYNDHCLTAVTQCM